MVHKETIENVTREYPRMKWSGCFAATIKEEIGAKPWSHTTVIDRFAEQVEGNKLMEPYE
jgi:cyanamide hydratase